MFKLDPSPSYFAPVAIDILDDDGIKRTHRFDARFARLNESQVADIQAQAEAKTITDTDVLDRVLLGWRGVQDASGVDLPYTRDAREQACAAFVGLRQALVMAWFASLSARESAVLAQGN